MTDTPREASRLGQFSWALFDWANQPFFTVITTFIFGPYFANVLVGDAVRGQTEWAFTQSMSGLLIAVASPILGAGLSRQRRDEEGGNEIEQLAENRQFGWRWRWSRFWFFHPCRVAVKPVSVSIFASRLWDGCEKTSGVTWERVLSAMRPWLARLIGSCPCCRTQFSEIFSDST